MLGQQKLLLAPRGVCGQADVRGESFEPMLQSGARSHFVALPDLHLGRAGGTVDGTQQGGSRRDGLDIAQATLELVPFEQYLRAGGTEQPFDRAQRIKRGEMTVARDQLDAGARPARCAPCRRARSR
jgi:hypothetical protein